MGMPKTFTKPLAEARAPVAGEADERLRVAIRAANVGLWDWDLRTNEVYYSPEWKRQIGYEDSEIANEFEEWRKRVHPDDLDRVLRRVEAYLAKPGPDYEVEFRFRHKDGGYRWILAQGSLARDEDGSPARFLGSHVDITQRRRVDDVLQSLVKSTGAIGEVFLEKLASELAGALAVNFAFVGELQPEKPGIIRSLSAWRNGQPAESFEYSLAGTPCEDVVGRELCVHPADVQKLFPNDAILAELNAYAYMGVPLFGSRGQPLGLIVVIHDAPITDIGRAKSILSIIAGRVGAELERIRAERTLRHNEELFRAIVEDQTEMIVRWLPDGTCTFANQAFCHVLGKQPREVIGSTCVPSLSEQGVDSIQSRIAFLSPSHPVATYIHESTSPTGKMLSEEWTDRGIFDADGKLVKVQSTGRDITERRRAEIRIHQLNRVYALLSNVNETIVRESDPQRLFDAACRIALEKGGFLMAWIGMRNPETGLLSAVANEGASADTLAILRRMFEDPRGGCAFTAHAMRTGEHAICNNIALDPAAAPWREMALERGYRSLVSLPIKVSGELVGTFNLYAGEPDFFDERELHLLDELVLDLGFALQGHLREEDRQNAETAREESEERFRQLTEAIQDVFWMVDAQKNEVLYVSPAYEQIWGRSVASLYESPSSWTDALHPDDRERVLHGVANRANYSAFDEEYRIVRPDGEVRWIRDRAFPITDPKGTIQRVAGVARDVTEQRTLQEQFRQSQKMEAIGQLAGGVAHDFNNILAAIIMQTELVIMSPYATEAIRKDLRDVCAAAERAASLTRQLLLFSRRQVLRTQSLDLNAAVTDLAKMLQRIIGTNIRLQLHLHGTPLRTSADAGMLDQVILNLAVNGRDAMSEGGQLIIETAEKFVDDAFARLNPDATPGHYVWLSVTDTGKGIAPEILPHIFEPFFTTKEPGKGTGLGLATVYGIVRQHRGWLHVYSQVGEGTSVQVFLPAETGKGEERSNPAQPEPAPTGSETILLAEDEDVVRRVVRIALEKHGYKVLEASSGDDAFALWRARGKEVDMLLTDLVMPGQLGGKQLAKQILADRADLKVIFISGYSPEIAGRDLVLRGGENFLQKPFNPTQLLVTIRKCLDS